MKIRGQERLEETNDCEVLPWTTQLCRIVPSTRKKQNKNKNKTKKTDRPRPVESCAA